MTVLYDIESSEVLSWHQHGYWVDGQKPQLPSNIVELDVVYADKPTPLATQKVVESWEAIDTEYKQIFTLVDKTDHEISVDDWMHMEWAIRITAPKSMLFQTSIGAPMFAYLNINKNLIINKNSSEYYIYVNVIEEEFEDLISTYNLTVENRPTPPIIGK